MLTNHLYILLVLSHILTELLKQLNPIFNFVVDFFTVALGFEVILREDPVTRVRYDAHHVFFLLKDASGAQLLDLLRYVILQGVLHQIMPLLLIGAVAVEGRNRLRKGTHGLVQVPLPRLLNECVGSARIGAVQQTIVILSGVRRLEYSLDLDDKL